ncbi:amidohydrolase [Aerococcaceae bacterium DSM 111022]|nr:amidohydrolase [Aerococcaceae bacterium DSM 111022]
MKEQLLENVEKYWTEIVQLRHYLHTNPELSGQEFKTSAYLKEIISKWGLPIEEVPADHFGSGTGFIATLYTGRPGKTIGLRTDIDALPVQEPDKNLKNTRVVKSNTPGVMHACGHDGHTATLIGAMRILIDHKDQLTGKIIFIFEEGEEHSLGIHGMIKLLQTKNIDAIYGNHLVAHLETGKIAVNNGPTMAALTTINFDIVGQGGHGSRPDLSVNPIFAGAAILNSISIAWNNQLNVSKTVTLGITQFNSGQTNNVFDDRAHIGGTLRYFDEAEGEKAKQILMNIAEQVGAVHGCTIEDYSMNDATTMAVINDSKLADLGKQTVEEVLPNALVPGEPWFASEGFAYYRQVAPSLFTFIGTKNDILGSGAEHHNEYFDIDDESLKYSIMTMVAFTHNYLK